MDLVKCSRSSHSYQISVVFSLFISVRGPLGSEVCPAAAWQFHKEVLMGRRETNNKEISHGKLEYCYSSQATWRTQNLWPKINEPINWGKIMVGASHKIWRIVGSINKRKVFQEKRTGKRYTPTTQGSPIWCLLLSSSPLITQNISRVPGNGLTIKIWEDKIMNNAPLSDLEQLKPLCDHFISINIKTLARISIWDDKRNWKGWLLSDVLRELD